MCYSTNNNNTLENPEFRGDYSHHLSNCEEETITYINSFKITRICTECELGLVSFAIFSSCKFKDSTSATTLVNYQIEMKSKLFDVQIG